jgi:hypothetical protein
MRRSFLVVLVVLGLLISSAPPVVAAEAPPLVVGVWPKNYAQFGEIVAASGVQLHLFRGRQRDGQFDSLLVPSDAQQAAAAGYSLGLNIQPKTGSGSRRTGILYTDITQQLLARSGPYYDKLVSFANEVLALPTYGTVTNYIQFHSEANVQAKPGVRNAHPYSGTGSEYRECFASIRQLFNELGVTQQIQWQIVLSRSAFEGGNGGPTNWFPADTTLYDLVGVDSYYRPKRWLTPSQSFNSAFAFAGSVGKPLWIDEIGGDEGGPTKTTTAKAEWFAAVGDWVDAHRTGLAGVVFSHASDGGNWFLDSVLSGGRATPYYTGITWNGWDALVDRLLPPPPPPSSPPPP